MWRRFLTILSAILFVLGSAPPTAQAEASEAPLTECDRLAAHPDDLQKAPEAPGLFELRRIDVAAATEACNEAISRHPEVPRFKYQLARALIAGTINGNSTDCSAALELLETAVRQGHAEAAYRRGRCIVWDPGDPGHGAERRAWFRMASDMGSLSAKASLARGMIATSKRYGPEVYQGLAILEELAGTGNIAAMDKLADLYSFGHWLERDRKKSFKYLVLAADRGHLNSEYQLGKMLVEGRGEAPHDPQRGRVYIERASAAGHPYAVGLLRKLNASRPAPEKRTLLPHGKQAK
jgi:TPR repeat protein